MQVFDNNWKWNRCGFKHLKRNFISKDVVNTLKYSNFILIKKNTSFNWFLTFGSQLSYCIYLYKTISNVTMMFQANNIKPDAMWDIPNVIMAQTTFILLKRVGNCFCTLYYKTEADLRLSVRNVIYI